MNIKELEKIVKNSLKTHLNEIDPDGFPICSIKYINSITYNRKSWLGTDEEFKKFKKEHERFKKETECEFCSLCNRILKL